MLGANDVSGQYHLASKSTSAQSPFECVDCKHAVHLVRRPEYVLFFRHNRAGGCGGEGALHKAAIELLVSESKLLVPHHPTIQPNPEDAVVCFRVESLNRSTAKGDRRRPDVVVACAAGRFAIEVTVSNPLSEERRRWFVQRGLPCIEIMVGNADLTSEAAIATFLVSQSGARQWVAWSASSNVTEDSGVAASLPDPADFQEVAGLGSDGRGCPAPSDHSVSADQQSRVEDRPDCVDVCRADARAFRPRITWSAPPGKLLAPEEVYLRDLNYMRRVSLKAGLSPADAEKAAVSHAERMRDVDHLYAGYI